MSKRILGLWNMGDGSFHKKLSPRESKDLIKEALRRGITSFDTAFSYKEADSMLSSALRESGTDREKISIISKVMPTETLERKAEASLRRLRTDYLDILLLHWPSDEASVYESLKRLEKLKESGKCRETGVSNFPLSLLKKAALDFPISYHERPLSLIWTKDWEEEKSIGLKTIAYAPLGMGLLSLKYRKKEDLKDSRKDLYVWKSSAFSTLLSYLSSLPYSSQAAAMSWVKAQSPYGIIQGAGRASDLDISNAALTEPEISRLTELAETLTADSPSDNIFSHNYGTIGA